MSEKSFVLLLPGAAAVDRAVLGQRRPVYLLTIVNLY
jgi:hypothetical protein